jgi:hypothetical protein
MAAITRYTSSARNVDEVINLPSDISSAAEIVTSSDVDLSRSTAMVLVPGRARRSAWGSTTCTNVATRPSPSASDASCWPSCTPLMAARKISERYAA